jgi:hypothetical protein
VVRQHRSTATAAITVIDLKVPSTQQS